MTAETLTKYFDRISEAPDAVARLRRFVLDLAVRGKLVEQDPSDESANELLERIQPAGSITTGKNHKRQVLVGEKNFEFSIPEGWAWARVGEICSKTGSGSTPRGGKDAYVPLGVPFLRSQNVYDDGLRLESVAYIAEKTHERMKATAVQPGDLLLNITGGSIGRCARVPVDFPIGNISQHVAIVRVALDEMIAFTHICIRSPYFQNRIFSCQTGAGREGLPKKRMDTIAIPIPPLAEQHRIVAKVHELMTLCDQLETAQNEREALRDHLVAASLDRVGAAKALPDDAKFFLNQVPILTARREHVKQLRKAILTLAVNGSLASRDANDQPVHVLLEHIKLDQQNKNQSSQFKKLKTEIKNDLHPIPPAWRWVRLAELITFGPQNGVSPKEVKDEKAPKALTLTATTSGFFNASNYKHVELSEKDCENYWLTSGDVLFQRGNTREYVGMAAIFDGAARSFIFPDLMIRVRFSKNLDLKYIHMALISPPLREYLSSEATGASTTMPKINQGTLLNAPIPLPPLAEQKRIVAKVDELMALCDQLETQLLTTESDSRRLLDAVLRDALAVS